MVFNSLHRCSRKSCQEVVALILAGWGEIDFDEDTEPPECYELTGPAPSPIPEWVSKIIKPHHFFDL